MSHRIVFLDRASLDAKVRAPKFDASYVEHAATAPNEVVGHLKGASIAITNKVPLRAEALQQLPDLKLIAVAATGYDVIDVPSAMRIALRWPTSAITPCIRCPSTRSR